jgi:hypothetical protein
MVMVLLFLGVVFLLVGFQSMGSDADTDSSSSSAVSTAPASTATSTSAKPAAPRPEVRVFNVSEVAGAAESTATRLRDAKWNVASTGNLTLEGITGTTVFFGDTPGEHEAADEVGKLLNAPVEPRRPELADQPPGVIVVVTG